VPLDPLDRDAADHEAFAASRARVYIGRQEYFDRLDAHAGGHGDQPLVILGESGSGKSALLANWAERRRAAHPDEAVLVHFIGATPYSSDWAAMLRRVLGEFKRRLGIEQDIPDQPDALRAAFANWLHMAAARGRVVLVLDALNQFEDRDGAPDLVWLPPVMPEDVRLFVSTLPGRPLDELKKRGWPTLVVKPLEPAERTQLIGDYLAQYSKSLGPARTERLAAAPQTTNPLYLRTLLEELRLFGVHERLDERIGHYLQAPTIPALFERVLERWENDYDRARPGLVRDAMTCLWAARRGLSESEVLDLLGARGQPLPRAHWSPLHLAAEQALVSRSGFLSFFHDDLRVAVWSRYLRREEHRSTAHLRLANHFETAPPGRRRLDELPWQLAAAAAWQRLYELLSDLAFVDDLWWADAFHLRSYWARLEERGFRMVDAYRAVLDAPGRFAANRVWTLSSLLTHTGHPAEALALSTHLVEHFRQIGDRKNLSDCLGNQAVILMDRGDLDGAMALHKQQEALCRELGNKSGLSKSLHNQALILLARGDLDGAMALHKQQEALCRELGKVEGLVISLIYQVLSLLALEPLPILKLPWWRRYMGALRSASRHSSHLYTLTGSSAVATALPLAEEAFRMVNDHGLVVLSGKCKLILSFVRRAAGR
jgi:hypothetical protein